MGFWRGTGALDRLLSDKGAYAHAAGNAPRLAAGDETEVPEELVSWDTAHERLDHERSFDRPNEPVD